MFIRNSSVFPQEDGVQLSSATGGCYPGGLIPGRRGGHPGLPLVPLMPRFLCPFASSAALAEITEMVAQLHGTMIKMENFQKLHELKKDLIGIDNLVIPGRVSSCSRQSQEGHV